MIKSLLSGIAALAMSLGLVAAAEAAEAVTIGYQTTVDPAKVAQADGVYENAIGWRKFDSGAEVNAAIASGAIDIGYVGSSPLAAAASNRLPIQTFFIATLIGDAEALVVRNGAGIKTPQDLVGKTVAVPFVSTTHYSLLAALKHWQIDPATVKIINVRPPEIAAGWTRGDIDAAYVWDPALGAIKPTGTVLVTSTEVAEWGAPTFDAYIVRKAFADANPAVVSAFVTVTADAYATYRQHPERYTPDSPEVKKISRVSGAKPEDVPVVLAGNRFPLLEEQASTTLLGGGTAKAIADTSAFLAEQKKIPQVLDDYTPYVTTRFVQRGDHALFPWLDVRRNVEFGLRVRGLQRAERQRRAISVLAQVGLRDAGRQPTWELSGGMQQRVGLARALASDPQVLLMDEPLGALDAITRQAMQTQTGKSIFLITHDIEEAILLASRLVIMSPSPGRIVVQRSLDFGRRYLAGEAPRHIKSDPAFIEAREEALAWILGSQDNTPHPFATQRQ